MKSIKQLCKSAVINSIHLACQSNSLRYLVEAEVSNQIILEPELYQKRSWAELDRIYSFCRRELKAQPDWRYGPARAHEVAREGFDAVKSYTSFDDRIYCDLGCGTYNPYGVSAVMYLNGARSTIALDLQDSNKRRSAEALADLLTDCITCPDKWHWSDSMRSDFLRRAQQFQLQALQAGRLEEGLAGLPLRHIVTDIRSPIPDEGSIDIMTSRAVLEHFLEFKVAIARLFGLMQHGGIAFHHIDLVDHRGYTDPTNYHWWSFLAEDESWSDGLVNRLRSCEIRPYFESAGFEILRYENRIGKMPEGFTNKIAGHFRGMPQEELNVTGVFCVLRKP